MQYLTFALGVGTGVAFTLALTMRRWITPEQQKALWDQMDADRREEIRNRYPHLRPRQ